MYTCQKTRGFYKIPCSLGFQGFTGSFGTYSLWIWSVEELLYHTWKELKSPSRRERIVGPWLCPHHSLLPFAYLTLKKSTVKKKNKQKQTNCLWLLWNYGEHKDETRQQCPGLDGNSCMCAPFHVSVCDVCILMWTTVGVCGWYSTHSLSHRWAVLSSRMSGMLH